MCTLPCAMLARKYSSAAEEDVTAIIETVIETRDDVKWLKRAVEALLADRGIVIAPDDDEGV